MLEIRFKRWHDFQAYRPRTTRSYQHAMLSCGLLILTIDLKFSSLL